MARVIIAGPMACGKSHHSQALARHFGCTFVNHDWKPGQGLVAGELALTARPAATISPPRGVVVMDFYDAMRKARIKPNSPFVDEHGLRRPRPEVSC